MKLVLLETPYAGDVERHVAFARACARDCLYRGEAPFASHLLYPGILDDDDYQQRALGIKAGLAWGQKAESTVVYLDLGVSDGMKIGIAHAETCGRPIQFRTLGWTP